ncbi:MAG TPA: hypothetical protein VMI30_11430 [Stellaceae bacterium]|nr:hypothetical protein [Stellaceae bacterium]
MTADEDDSNPTPAEAALADTVTAESATDAAALGQPLRPRRRRRRRRNPARLAAATTGSTPPEGEPADGATSPAAPSDGVTVEAAPARALGENTLRLRTRPPRRRPPGIRPASEAGAAAPPETAGEDAANSSAGESDVAGPAAPRLGPDGQPLRRRRRRRRPPQLGGAGEKAAGESAASAEAGQQTVTDPNHPPRRRSRRPRVDRAGDRPAAEGDVGVPRERRYDSREGSARGPRNGDNRGRSPSGQRGRRDDRDGRGGRDDRPARVERKLYTLDSVVDRGFEDVEEESGTRRVTWTIVKRTIADQITRKPMSQNYVLQRDGVDSEFPSLGAARDAVNKRIVHPEKLTLSKAEHVAQKSGR